MEQTALSGKASQRVARSLAPDPKGRSACPQCKIAEVPLELTVHSGSVVSSRRTSTQTTIIVQKNDRGKLKKRRKKEMPPVESEPLRQEVKGGDRPGP